MPNEIDMVMDMTADELLANPEATALVIQVQREHRARMEAGIKAPRKTKVASASGPKTSISLADLGLSKKKEPDPNAPKLRRL